MNGTILIYGATGYTGRLIAKAASDKGARPILAGRNLDKVKRVAEPLGLSARTFDLGDPARIDAAVKDVSVVLCAAGPFSATSRPVADACLRNRVHYLDITGEIDVFEALAARDAEAQARGVVLLPGVGFDVVPSDCLAAHLKRRLPDANDLELYLSLGANMSRGTAKTMIEAIAWYNVEANSGQQHIRLAPGLSASRAARALKHVNFPGDVEVVNTVYGRQAYRHSAARSRRTEPAAQSTTVDVFDRRIDTRGVAKFEHSARWRTDVARRPF